MKRSETRRQRSSTRKAARTPVPTFRALDRADCDAILERNWIGRIAFSFRDRVDIEPITYVYDSEGIVGRTSQGAKLETLRHSPWVAFEVDEVDDIFDWRSVVAHGTFRVLTADGPPAEAAAYERAIELLRDLIPATAGAADPTPFRTVVFRITVDEMTGREAAGGRR